jgi:hypothetical protein
MNKVYSLTIDSDREHERLSLSNASRPSARAVRDAILLFRCVLEISPCGRRSAQIAFDAAQRSQEVVLWR